MTSKEFLNRPYQIKRKIANLELELDRYETMMNSIPQPSYGTVRIDKSPSKESPNQIGLEKYYETLEKIKEAKQELYKVSQEIRTAIEKLDVPSYKSILEYKYIQGMTWEEIASKIYVAYSTVRKWHKLALDSFKLINYFSQ